MTTEQEHQLELEIRMLEEQLGGGSSPQSPQPISPAAPVAVPQVPVAVPQVPRSVEKPSASQAPASARVAAPRAFVSEYAHLTRSEYIKLKAKLRGAAQMIQSKAKTFLLRRYLSVAERVFAVRRIQGSCRGFLAKAMLADGRRRKQFRFVLLVARCQARFRRRLRRKREEEARQWEESLGKLQRQAVSKVQAKCRSFLALALLMNQRLALRKRGSAASVIQRSCRVHLSRVQALQRRAVVNEQERLRLRAVLRLQTLLKGMRARQELTHLRIQNDEDERRRRRLLEDEEEMQIEELNPEPMWPDLSLEDRLQALWEHVLAQQHEQARREEEVKRLKKLLTQQRVDKDFQPNCWSCDQHLLDLDALLRALQRICLAAMGGDTPGTRPEKVIVGKVASTLTAVVNEIEEAGGKVTVQLKELAAYLAWVSVHSSSAARRLDPRDPLDPDA